MSNTTEDNYALGLLSWLVPIGSGAGTTECRQRLLGIFSFKEMNCWIFNGVFLQPFTTQQSIPLQRFKGYYNGELTAMPSNVQEVPADYSSLGNFNEPYTDADHIPENNQGRDHVEGDQFQQEQQQPIKTGVASGGVSGGDQFAPVNPLKSPARFRVRTQPGVLRTQSQQQFADPFVPSGFGLTPSESVELQNGNKKSSFPWNWIFVSPVNQLHSDQQPIVLEQVPYGTGLTQVGKCVK